MENAKCAHLGENPFCFNYLFYKMISEAEFEGKSLKLPAYGNILNLEEIWTFPVLTDSCFS